MVLWELHARSSLHVNAPAQEERCRGGELPGMGDGAGVGRAL